MTRQEMIEALTLFELQYMMDYPESVKDVAKFFAEGGFNNRTDAELRESCKDNVWVETEGESK
jgi:hypothetical protein